MGSGRGDRNQQSFCDSKWKDVPASMGSGRGDRNQNVEGMKEAVDALALQWGPVVVTGIRGGRLDEEALRTEASMGSGRGDRNQEP